MRTAADPGDRFDLYFRIVLCLALFLRVAGIGFGLPFLYHQDEPIIVNRALALGASGPNPHFFVLPSFTIYFMFFIYAGLFAVGKLSGFFYSAQDVGFLFVKDPSIFYLAGRLFLGALFGTLTVWMTGKTGKVFFSKKAGLAAALFLAVAPVHVELSHYIYADAALTFAVPVFFYALLAVLRKPSTRHYLYMGAAFAFGVSIKYTMAYFFLAITAAHCLVHGRRIFGRDSFLKAALSALSALAVFAALSPYIFLDWHEAIRQILFQKGAEGTPGPWHHLRYSLIGGTSPIFFVAALAGAAALWHSHRKESVVLLTGFISYYGVISAFSQHFARYALPLLPLVCLWGGTGWGAIETRFRGSKWTGLVFALLLMSLVLPSVYLDVLFMKKDTRTECLEWIEKNLPPGTKIAMDNRFFGPHLTQTREQVLEKYQYIGRDGKHMAEKTMRLDFTLKNIERKKTYNVYTLAENPEVNDKPFLFQTPFIKMTPEALEKEGIDYIIYHRHYSFTDPKNKDLAMFNFMNTLKPHIEKIASFSPFKDPVRHYPADYYSMTAATFDKKDLLSRKTLGPYLEIYRLKK